MRHSRHIFPNEFDFINADSKLAYRSDTVTESGGVVNPWDGLAGGKDLTQASAGSRPGYNANDSGTPSVVYDGGNDHNQVSVSGNYLWSPSNPRGTFAYVGRLRSIPVGNVRYWGLSTPPFVNNRMSLRHVGGMTQFELSSTGALEVIDILPTDTDVHVYVITVERTGTGVDGTGGATGFQHTVNIWLDGTKVVSDYLTTGLMADMSFLTFTMGAFQTSSILGFSPSNSKQFNMWSAKYNGGIINTINSVLINEYL